MLKLYMVIMMTDLIVLLELLPIPIKVLCSFHQNIQKSKITASSDICAFPLPELLFGDINLHDVTA